MTRGRRGASTHGDDGDTRRLGLLVALVPVVLFALSFVFVALRGPAEERAACAHDHAVEDVRAWWSAARGEQDVVPGTRYIAFDESPACIRVGLDRAEARSHLERRFRSLGVPPDAVVWEMAEEPESRPPASGGEEVP